MNLDEPTATPTPAASHLSLSFADPDATLAVAVLSNTPVVAARDIPRRRGGLPIISIGALKFFLIRAFSPIIYLMSVYES